MILENLDNLLLNKPDFLIIHAGINYLTNGENTLNQANTIVQEVKKMLPNTKIVLSSIFKQKGWKGSKKKAIEIHSSIKKLW